MDAIVTLTHRNVCKEGFTVVDTVDAGTLPQSPIPISIPSATYDITETRTRLIVSLVFLDLPAPWEAVPHAKVALRVSLVPTRLTGVFSSPRILTYMMIFVERPPDEDMLLQSVYRTGYAYSYSAEPRRLHR